MSIIETRGLTKRYRGGVLAVHDLDLQVERGQVFGFLGPNGSGKTTTIGMLVGIITPTAGEIRLFGEGGRAALQSARQRMGATLETPNFYPYLSGRDNLRLVARVKEVEHSRVDEVLELVGLESRARDEFARYSLGMKQRLAIAATMIGDPELIILDEPANGLDPEGMREVREVILRLAAGGKTIFLSSHLLAEVERTCTHVAILKQGRMIRCGRVDEILHGGVRIALRAADAVALRAAVEASPSVRAVVEEGADLVVELADEDPAALNRFLAGRGIWLHHLARRRTSLEEVFMAATGDGAAHMEDLATASAPASTGEE